MGSPASISKRLSESGLRLQEETAGIALEHQRFVINKPGQQQVDRRVYLCLLGGTPVSFGANTPTMSAQSTVEAVAIRYGAKEAAYLSKIMIELSFTSFVSTNNNPEELNEIVTNDKHCSTLLLFMRSWSQTKTLPITTWQLMQCSLVAQRSTWPNSGPM